MQWRYLRLHRTLRIRERERPFNYVVKLEVSTARLDICCPLADRTDFATESGVVIAPGRILPFGAAESRGCRAFPIGAYAQSGVFVYKKWGVCVHKVGCF